MTQVYFAKLRLIHSTQYTTNAMASHLDYATLNGQLVFERSVFPQALICNDNTLTGEQLSAWVKANKLELEQQLSQNGVILFRGFAVHNAQTFDDFAAAFGYPSFTYQESLSNAVRINFTERVFTANEAPPDVEIFLHHEMAQTPLSPDKLFFFCQSAAQSGGATPVCRSDLLYSELQAQNPDLAQEFETKGLKYTTAMPLNDDVHSGQGRSWKSTLSVSTKEQAETKLQELGYTWKWQDNGWIRATTPVLPAVKELSCGTKSFYNQLIAAYLGWEGVQEDPSRAVTFGDGSKIPAQALADIVKLADQFTFDLAWQDGDVALIDNKLAMHGRRPYSGSRKRQVLVALAA